MPVIRIVLLFVVVGGLALFAFSNLSPVLPLVFLGLPTAPLPLATWIGMAIASGIFTSFLLQFLQFLQRSTPSSFAEPSEARPQTPPFRRESEPEPIYSRSATASPPPETPRTNAASDWEEDNAQSWEFEQPARANSSPEVRDETSEAKPPSGVYSYSYREQDKKQAGVGKADAIYDANYRVITPPNQNVKPDEDEDWGFEDDEEFNDQSKNTKPRR